MGKEFLEYFESSKVYNCKKCGVQLSTHSHLISKTFSGKFGRAFLMGNVINSVFDAPEEKILMTGLHIICNMKCKVCNSLIGWRYEKAYQATQKYKEGKFILERNQVFKDEWNIS